MLEKVFLKDYKDLNVCLTEKKRFGFLDKGKIKDAYYYAEQKHRGIKRNSGEPYIVHPLNVAKILVDINASVPVIIAGLLHDVLEDTDTTYDELATRFGTEVAQLVESVTKVSTKIKTIPYNEEKDKVITLIKILDSFGSVLIKLADKLHNMRTIEYKPPHKQIKTAQECIDIFVPLAHSSGVYSIKTELEDICFSILDKENYLRISEFVKTKAQDSEKEFGRVVEELKFKLKSMHIIPIEIKRRVKEAYSVYKKLENKNKKLDEIYDLLGIRIILKDEQSCFMVSAIITKNWNAIKDSYKNYINYPKENGYQSIHHTLISNGVFIEVQIRSKEMDTVAEYGSASHFVYKTGKARNIYVQSNVVTEIENVENIKSNLIDDRMIILTPKGGVVKIPEGSTVIDFAYSLDPKLGNKMVGAKVNGQVFPIRNKLTSGDTVEVSTSDTGTPKIDWLVNTKTTVAKNHIKQWLTENSSAQKISVRTSDLQLEKLKTQLKDLESDKTLTGNRTVAEDEDFYKYIYIDGLNNVMCHLAKCCSPKIGDEDIVAIVGKKGIAIHKSSCENVEDYYNNKPEKVLEVFWNFKAKTFIYEFDLIFVKDADNDIVQRIDKETGVNKKNFVLRSSSLLPVHEEAEDDLYSLKIVFEIKNAEFVNYLEKFLSSTTGLLSMDKRKLN